MRPRPKKALRAIGVHTLLIIIISGLVFPYLWLVSTSFKPPNEVFSMTPAVIPITPTLDNYTAVMFGRGSKFFIYAQNTLIVSIATSVLGVLVTTLSAYALSRFRFTGRRAFMIALLATQMFPGILFLAPLYVILKTYGLLNTLAGLILAYSTFVIPFSTWMLKGYFDGIPIEMEESAMIDGCSRLGALRRVTLPLAAPGMAAVVLFAFLMGWQEFLFAISFIQTDTSRMLSVAVAMAISQFGSAWGQLMAIAVLVSLPVVILFAYLQKFIVQGLTAGAVKG
jgi:ABC-type glycerol-3-phosphate transport system permease component